MSDRSLKSGWTRVAFGDVVRQVKDRVEPAMSGLKRYVAGDHMDTDDLHIRRWGEIGDGYLGPAFHMRFRPGQVLYGSRRTYLRKVAVADFEGITANTTFVLESKNSNILLPNLLPFIMSTESFHKYSIGKSKGSVNPYVNFSDLATYDLRLPPRQEQQSILSVLRAGYDLWQAIRLAHIQFESIIDRFALDTYSNLFSTVQSCRTADFGEATMGRQKSPKYCRGITPKPYLRVANVGRLDVKLDEIHKMDFTPIELDKFRLLPNDVLITEGDLVTPSNAGRSAVFHGEIEDCCFQNTLIRFRPHPDVPALFASLLFEGARLNGVFAKAAKTTTVTHIGLGRFREIPLPFPDADIRSLLSNQFQLLLDSRRRLDRRLVALRTLTTRLLAEVFA